MADYNANIRVSADTSEVERKLGALQRQLSELGNIKLKDSGDTLGGKALTAIQERTKDINKEAQSLGDSFRRLGTILQGAATTGGLALLAKTVIEIQTNLTGMVNSIPLFGAKIAAQAGQATQSLSILEKLLTGFGDAVSAVGGPGNAAGIAALTAGLMAFGPQVLRAAQDTEKLGDALGKIAGTEVAQKLNPLTQGFKDLNVELSGAKSSVEEFLAGSNFNQLNAALKDATNELNSYVAFTDQSVKAAEELLTVERLVTREKQAQNALLNSLDPNAARKVGIQSRIDAVRRGEVGGNDSFREFIARSAEIDREANRNLYRRMAGTGGFGPGFGPEVALSRQLALPSTEMLNPASRGIQRLGFGTGDFNLDKGIEAGRRFTESLGQAVNEATKIPSIFEKVLSSLETVVQATGQGANKMALWAEALRQMGLEKETLLQLDAADAREVERATNAEYLRLRAIRTESNIQQVLARNKQEEEARQARAKRMESLALGAGFPLLFGGGPGSLVGGVAGSFVGEGFGGQILLSAIGSQLDKFLASVIQIGKATLDLAGSFNELQQAMVFASRSQEQQIKLLLDAGRIQEAANAIQKRLNDVVGPSGAQDLQKVGVAADELSRAWAELTLQMQAALAGPLGTILRLISGGVRQQTATNNFDRALYTDPKAFTAFVQRRNKEDNLGFRDLMFNPELNANRRTQLAQEFLSQSKYSTGGNAQLTPEESDKARKAAEATADKIKSAYREGFALQQKGQDLERQAIDLRRNFENEIFNRRQEIARLEISNQRQSAQVQIEATDLALRKQFAGAEGFEAQVLGAAREYIKSTAEGQADLEAKRRTLDLDLAKIRKGVQDYEYSVQQQINSYVRSTEQYKMDVADYQLKISRQINDESRITAAMNGAGGGVTAGAGFSANQINKATTDASKFTGIANECAESVKSFYKSLGISLPGVTAWADSVRKAGVVMTDWSKLQPGDIVAKGKPGDTSHVGVYTGGDSVFHQSASRGLRAGNFPDLSYFQQGGYFVRPTTEAKFADAKNNIRPMAPGGIPGAPNVSGLGGQLEAATQKQVELETKLSKLKQDGALFALKQAAEGTRVIQQKTDELNLAQAEARSLQMVSQQEQQRLTRTARNNELLKQTAAENERILKALKPQLDSGAYKQVEAALATRLDLKRQELAIDEQLLAVAQQQQFIEQRNGLQSQLGVVGAGARAGYIGNAASTYESAIMQYGDTSKAKELADLTRQIDLAKLSSDAFNESIQGIGQAFSQSMAEGVGSLTTGAASAQQIFVNMLNAMQSALISAAAKMIAQYIAIGIARMFAGMGTQAAAPHATSLDQLNMADISKYSTPIPGHAAGGPVNSGSPYIVGEKGPELFVPSASGRIIPNHQMGGSANSATNNIVINVDAKGTAVQGNESQGKQLAMVVSAAVQAEMIKQQRPGGILYNR